jgi:NitT/TauT family transport system ATP-binding protein
MALAFCPAAGRPSKLITVDQLCHSYISKGTSADALIDLSLTIDDGEFVAVIGPSGCGKTTFLNILSGLEVEAKGDVEVDGRPPKAGRRDIGFGPARDSLLPWRRAIDNAALALEIHGMSKRESRERARSALRVMGLGQAEQFYPAQLSQGMRQRVALARLFCGEPTTILLDEPFSALDAQTRVKIQDAFLGVWEARRPTVLLVTHDLGEAITLADRIVVMTRRPGRIKAIYPVDLPRPRVATTVRADPRFHQAYEAIWADIADEVSQAELENEAALLAQSGSGQ